MKLVGYSNRLSVAPGDTISFMVSSELDQYQADLVRLIHGDNNPVGPGFKAPLVPSTVSGVYPGRHQRLRPGSYVRIGFPTSIGLANSFTIHMWIWPTSTRKPVQTLISSYREDGFGFAIRLLDGRLHFVAGQSQDTAVLDRPLTDRRWYSIAAVFDGQSGVARLSADEATLTSTARQSVAISQNPERRAAANTEVLIAGEHLLERASREVGNFYNGKIDAPRIYSRALSPEELVQLRKGGSPGPGALVASWDFSRDIATTRIADVSGNAHHGVVINRPTRAVAGHDWNGSEVVWTNSPAQYGAIHFHEDDLDDAGWEVTASWAVPDTFPSAIYALHVHADGNEDYIPFAVRPKRGMAASQIVFLMPTFSYLAYGNSRMAGRPETMALVRMLGGGKSHKFPCTPQDEFAVANGLNSLYDTHTDGSGCCHASWLRPIVSMRPKYNSQIMGLSVPHQLNADLHLIDWLVERGYVFDVVADENLHHEGRALLDPYKVLLTGTHPEYWSEQMIRACQQYLHGGGRMMYMGGNGMYWVTELDPEAGHSIEMRRVQPSSPRFFDPHPGELHLSTTGQRAGLWRGRGLPTQTWLGVVMAAAGRTGQHYLRRPASLEYSVAWIFEGIDRNEPIGNFRSLYSGYGAVGGEVDRVDSRMEGTPDHTTVLATSAPLDHTWVWDPVDPPSQPRADMALLDYPNGGAVFSMSSIAWCSCLSYNGYHNNVSRLTQNVLEGFLNRAELRGKSDTSTEFETGPASGMATRPDR